MGQYQIADKSGNIINEPNAFQSHTPEDIHIAQLPIYPSAGAAIFM